MTIVSGIGAAGITGDPGVEVPSEGILGVGANLVAGGQVQLFGSASGSTLITTASTGNIANINFAYSTPAPLTVTSQTATITTSTPSIIINLATSVTLTLPSPTVFPGAFLKMKTVQATLVASATSNVVLVGTTTAGATIFASAATHWAEMQSDGTNWIVMASA